jgi:hypothetical protein
VATGKYEVCDHCSWNGPVNKYGTMRKHRLSSGEYRRGSAGQVQDMNADVCPGSHQPPRTFGIESPQEGTMKNENLTPGLHVTFNGEPYTVVRPDSDRMVMIVPGDTIPSRGLGRVAEWVYSSTVQPR